MTSDSILETAVAASQRNDDHADVLHEIHKAAAMRWLEVATPAINSRLAAVLKTSPDANALRDMTWVLAKDSNYEALYADWDSLYQRFTLDSALEGLPIRVLVTFPDHHGYRKFNKKVATAFTAAVPGTGDYHGFTSLAELGAIIRSGSE